MDELRGRLERLRRLAQLGRRRDGSWPSLGVSEFLAALGGLCAVLGLVRLVAVGPAGRVVPGFLICAGVALAAVCFAVRRDRTRLRLALLVGLEVALVVAIYALFLELWPPR